MNFDRRICCSVSDPTNSGRCVVRFPNFGKSILYPKTNKTKTNSPFNSILYYFYPSVCSTDTHKCIYLSTLIYLSIYLSIYLQYLCIFLSVIYVSVQVKYIDISVSPAICLSFLNLSFAIHLSISPSIVCLSAP